jgi:hypothetical protein
MTGEEQVQYWLDIAAEDRWSPLYDDVMRTGIAV